MIHSLKRSEERKDQPADDDIEGLSYLYPRTSKEGNTPAQLNSTPPCVSIREQADDEIKGEKKKKR